MSCGPYLLCEKFCSFMRNSLKKLKQIRRNYHSDILNAKVTSCLSPSQPHYIVSILSIHHVSI